MSSTPPASGSFLSGLDSSRLFWATVGAAAGTAVATAVYYVTYEPIRHTYQQYVPLKVTAFRGCCMAVRFLS